MTIESENKTLVDAICNSLIYRLGDWKVEIFPDYIKLLKLPYVSSAGEFTLRAKRDYTLLTMLLWTTSEEDTQLAAAVKEHMIQRQIIEGEQERILAARHFL